MPLWAFSQNITVKGIVKDAIGESVIGASVVEKGTTNGIITGLDGDFTLQVRKDATLVISFIGYVTQEVKASTAPLNITLQEDSKTLEEVVVIGYGTAKRSDVTGSIASMRGDDLRTVQTGNISSALQGVLPVLRCHKPLPDRVPPCKYVYAVHARSMPATIRW